MMTYFYNLVKADYLQRVRGYTFIVTLLASVVMAYSFAPPETANYSTVKVGKYVGYNNAAWIGHVTAIMASTFLWLIGFYVINNGLRRDNETGVGQIIATTSITNFKYLLAKSLSNFLVLLTITAVIFLMALGLTIVRGSAYQFDITQFLFPYLFATIPSLFVLAALAVVFEVVFGKRTNLLNVVFFLLFAAIVFVANASNYSNLMWFDPLGTRFLTNQVLTFINTSFAESNTGVSIGFHSYHNFKATHFLYPGSTFTIPYIFSRLIWITVAFISLKVTARFFNRFDSNVGTATRNKKILVTNVIDQPGFEGFRVESLAKTEPDFSISPLIKMEFLMLLRKGSKWFWMINGGIFIALALLPLDMSLKTGLPIFWFLQINRWADLSTKEHFFGTDKFIYSTYKPLQRLLVSQILAGVVLAVLLALPVLLKLITSNFIAAAELILGAIILVSFSICSGIVSGGKRFFEVFLFMITYLSVQGMNFLDYWGGSHHSFNYIVLQISIIMFLLCAAFFVRQYVIKKQ